MIYLITGANGAGKTLNTLDIVRKKQLEEGRTVYYHGFDIKPAVADQFGWLPFDPLKWQDLPDGGILICDECQKEFPVRSAGSAVPGYVAALAEHRKRGFDFFMVTQHPQNIDSFVRRLIGSPGWHRHFKRVFGADMVSMLEWSAVNPNCEKSGAGSSAKVSMVPFPKHVYDWYDSAVLHTAKASIPFKVWLLGSLVLLIPLVFYFGFGLVGKKSAPVPPAVVVSGGVPAAAGAPAPMTPAQYLESFTPRLHGFPNTAPRYDAITVPTEAPYPAGCAAMAGKCTCYTLQATKIDVPAVTCLQIIKDGYFKDWGSVGAAGAKPVLVDKQV